MSQQMIILGAGTALPDAERDNTFMVWHARQSLLIDCGGRAYQQLLRAAVDPLSVRALLVTHSHPDHIYGVPAFLFHLWLAQRSETLDVYGEATALQMIQQMCDAMRLPQKGYMCPVAWHTLSTEPEALVFDCPEYRVATMPVEHTVPCLAVKIVDHESKRTLVYSSDTKPSAAIRDSATGVGTLIHEATTADPHQNYGHSTPYQAGEIARDTGVEQLVLIHFSSEYTMSEAEAIDQVRGAGFEGMVKVARELERYAA